MRRIVIAAMVLFALAVTAGAQEWKGLRNQGIIGETFDGFLRPVTTPSASVQAVVNNINAQRRQLYIQRAGETGTTVDQVGRIFFQENLTRLPKGTWILLENGHWVRK